MLPGWLCSAVEFAACIHRAVLSSGSFQDGRMKLSYTLALNPAVPMMSAVPVPTKHLIQVGCMPCCKQAAQQSKVALIQQDVLG